MACHFEPAALDLTEDGHYLYFEWLGPTLLCQMSRDIYLDHIRARLLYCLAARLAGKATPGAIARRFCGNGESFNTVKQRYARLRDYASSFSDSEKRKNGIVSACLEHLAKHTDLIATLFDAPIWEIAKGDHWSLKELEMLRKRVESMGVSVPDDPTTEFGTCCYYFELCQSGVHGAPTIWTAANLTVFCLARAQAVGDLVQYGVAYDAMISHAHESQMAKGTDVLTLIVRDFWEMFVRFVRLWHSRVRVTCVSEHEIKYLADFLKDQTVEVSWQVIANGTLRRGMALPRVLMRSDLWMIFGEQNTRAHRWGIRYRLCRVTNRRSCFLAPQPGRKPWTVPMRYRVISFRFDAPTLSVIAEKSGQSC